VVGLLVLAAKSAKDGLERHKLFLLFITGSSSSVFLAVLSIKAHHYTPLHTRYFTFCIPFCTLFTVYAFKLIWEGDRLKKIVTAGLFFFMALPLLTLHVIFLHPKGLKINYNHQSIAATIVKNGAHDIELPAWREAFLLQCFLPKNYDVTYRIDSANNNFVIHNNGVAEVTPVVRHD
jgi:hypothetical protein